jgi:hypothetical protein
LSRKFGRYYANFARIGCQENSEHPCRNLRQNLSRSSELFETAATTINGNTQMSEWSDEAINPWRGQHGSGRRVAEPLRAAHCLNVSLIQTGITAPVRLNRRRAISKMNRGAQVSEATFLVENQLACEITSGLRRCWRSGY